MKKIIVLGGGNSVERDVSLRSSREVLKALKENKFEVDLIDPKYSRQYLQAPPGAIVFPILHGEFGEDGTVQKELERRSIAYLGSNSASSKVCFDKWLTRRELEKYNIAVAKGELVDRSTYFKSDLAKKPHVLKATNGGSSIGTAVIRSPDKIDSSEIKNVFTVGFQAVVEELVEGLEITVPILDNQALPVIEIYPPPQEEFDFKNKYNGKTKEICPPIALSNLQQEDAKRLAEKVHTLLGCRHLSRVDMIVQNDGKMVVLEINTMPGLTAQSLYPKSALQFGLSFPDLTEKFVNFVSRDYGLD